MGNNGKMKKVVVTGSNGQLVSDLIKVLSFGEHCEYEVFPFTREELDVTDVENVSYVFDDLNPYPPQQNLSLIIDFSAINSISSNLFILI